MLGDFAKHRTDAFLTTICSLPAFYLTVATCLILPLQKLIVVLQFTLYTLKVVLIATYIETKMVGGECQGNCFRV